MQDASLAERVGALVRHLRSAAGLSQEEFAHRCGLHRTYMGAIERGEKTMTIATADKLCQALGLTLSQFFAHLENESRGLSTAFECEDG